LQIAGINILARSPTLTAAADRHLLFGLLAFQNGLIDQGALVAALQTWTRDRRRHWPTSWLRGAT
jgi:hypothetical protein